MTASATRKREVGRGERVMPGVWRLRLPLSFPGVPHVNAWVVAAGDGVVLFDCGLHEPGSLANLERAMDQVNLRLEHVRLLVCTHAHLDHYGQAADVLDAADCELWMHPAHQHVTRAADDPDSELERRLEVAGHNGVPAENLRRYAAEVRDRPPMFSRVVLPHRELVTGVEVQTDLGPWSVHETPGHAPSQVCLVQADKRLLISGDHLLGRISQYFDVGHTPDPVGEFLASLDTVDALDARLCLSGHGRTFTDVHAHVEGNRTCVAQRLQATRDGLAEHGPLTAYELLRHQHPDVPPEMTGWLLTNLLATLRHLEVRGQATHDGGEPERWGTV